MDICHYSNVNLEEITEYFSSDRLHRAFLKIPLKNRSGNKTICIVGQNPSKANIKIADRTLHYIERYVYENMPKYSQIIMLNLYSRLDTNKTAETDLIRLECERLFRSIIRENSDFLIVYGKLKNQGAYKFKKKAQLLQKHLKAKAVYKIDIGSAYPPHPGNKKIYYGNYCYGFTEYKFT